MNNSVKHILRQLRLYKPTRLLMHWHLNQGVVQENQRLLAFYRSFIKPGDLVFDVGANIGRRSEIFMRLGARVIAVEPNPDCAWQIDAMFPPSKVLVERVGVGAAPGRATMHLCDDDHMSSLSEDWIKRMKESRLAKYSWQRSLEIDIVTLDQLIAKHGSPAFVKIDTEGFELQVVSGLTSPIRALSFEYNPELVDVAVQSLRAVNRLGDYRYNLSPGETLQFLASQWMTCDQVEEALRNDQSIRVHNYGDVYARLQA